MIPTDTRIETLIETMKRITLPKAYNSRGAQMGRPNSLPENRDATGKLRLVRLSVTPREATTAMRAWESEEHHSPDYAWDNTAGPCLDRIAEIVKEIAANPTNTQKS